MSQQPLDLGFDAGMNVFLDRDLMQEPFYEFLTSIALDGYGLPRWPESGHDGQGDPAATMKNAVFCVRPYYWGEDDVISDLPNFEHYPSGLKVTWYKYVLRSGQANREIALPELLAIFQECRDSLGADFRTGEPAPDLVGTVEAVRVTPRARFLDLRDVTGQRHSLFLAGSARTSPLLKVGTRVGVVVRAGTPSPMAVTILEAKVDR